MHPASLIWIFLAGFVVSHALAAKSQRSAFKAASAMPLAIVLLALAFIFYVLAIDSTPGDSFADLATATILMVYGITALVAFFGGLLGVWWRRKDIKPQ